MLDGVLARSIFLKDFAMHETVEAFKHAILLYLGFKREKVSPVRQARQTVRASEY